MSTSSSDSSEDEAPPHHPPSPGDTGFGSDPERVDLEEFSTDNEDVAPRAPAVVMDDCLVRGVSKRGMQPLMNKQPKDFVFLKTIGEGAFSTVYRAREVNTDTEYAIKCVIKAHVQRAGKTKTIIREKNVMALLTYVHGAHPFVVSLYCTFQDDERLYFALSYCAKGDLLETLKRVSSFDTDTTRFFAAEIVAGLDFIHKSGIVHRDLKPENILIKQDGHIAITDFGSSKILAEEERQEEEARRLNVETAEDRGERRATFVGTAQYVSPEMLNGDAVGIECDLWALGAICYQMMSGQPPFRAVNDYHLMKKIQLLDFAFPPGFPPLGHDLVKKLLVLDPTTRIGAKGQPKIEKHAFFEPIDFPNLPNMTPPQIHPYVPASFGEPEFYSDLTVEPGLDANALSRLLMLNLNENATSFDIDQENAINQIIDGGKKKHSVATSTPGHDILLESNEEKAARIRAERLEKQKNENEYHKFVEGNLIIRSGLVDKKKGLFARRRMFLLTEGPHLYYVDPVTMTYKGQIPMCYELRTEAKNFRTFFIHAPNRTYYLFDPSRNAVLWCETIEKVRAKYFKEPSPYDDEDDDRMFFGIVPCFWGSKKARRRRRLEKERKKMEAEARKTREDKERAEKKEKKEKERAKKREKERLDKVAKQEEKEKKKEEKKAKKEAKRQK